jgi:hypothetical protein
MNLETAVSVVKEAAVAISLNAAILGVVVDAQRPQRQQEVYLPGLGIALKAGWQLRFHDGCRFAVPPTWRATLGGDQAFAPDGSSLWVWAVHVPSWSLHKSQVKAAFAPLKSVRKDDEHGLWIESGDSKKSEQYIAVTDGSMACEGLLEIRTPAVNRDDTAQTIGDSIGVAPAVWPSDLN